MQLQLRVVALFVFVLLITGSDINAQSATFRNFQMSNSNIPSNYVDDVFYSSLGPGGRVYAATNGGGLGIYNPANDTWIKINNTTSGFPANVLNKVIVVDDAGSEGDIMVGSNGSGYGYGTYSAGTYTWETFNTGNSGIGGDNIVDIEDAGDDKWFVHENGVSKLSSGTFTNFSAANLSASICYVVREHNGLVIAATNNGVSVYDGSWTNYSFPSPQLGNIAFTMDVTGGKAFVGNYHRGLFIFDLDARTFSENDVTTEKTFNHIAYGSDGFIYLGMWTSGIYVGDEGSFTHFTASNGLVGNTVLGVAAGGGYTWVGTNVGLSRMLYSSPNFRRIWVDKSNPGGDGSWYNPFEYISYATAIASENDTIRIYTGTYDEIVPAAVDNLTLHVNGGDTLAQSQYPTVYGFDISGDNFSMNKFNAGNSAGEPSLYIHDNANVWLDEIFANGNADSYGLRVSNVNGLEVTNSEFSNNGATDASVYITNSSNLNFENVSADNNTGAGFYLDQAASASFENITGNNNGLSGFTASNSSGVTVTSGEFNSNDENGLELQSTGYSTFESLTASLNIFNGLTADDLNVVAISNSSFENNSEAGLIVQGSDSLTLTSIVSNSNADGGYLFDGVTNGWFSSLEGSDNDDRGFSFTDGSNLTLTGSQFNENEGTGLYVFNLSGLTAEDVTANNNTGAVSDGLEFTLVDEASFTDLTARYNGRFGLNVGEGSGLSFVNGNFSYNLDGVHIHPHYESDADDQDSISALTFNGVVHADSNSRNGIVLMTDADLVGAAYDPTVIVSPSFTGEISLVGNGTAGLKLEGLILSPVFEGLSMYGSGTNSGALITGKDGSGNYEPLDVSITNSMFGDFSGAGPNYKDYAISLIDFNGRYSTSDVSAVNNYFTNVSYAGLVILDSVDYNYLGAVDTTGWDNGLPVLTISSLSTYTGAMFDVSLDVELKGRDSMNSFKGAVYYDPAKIQYVTNYIGTGTLINEFGWIIQFLVNDYDSTDTDTISFVGVGFDGMRGSGSIFSLTFEVVQQTSGAALISGFDSEFEKDDIASLFAVNNGTITYTVPPFPATSRGDATLNWLISASDAVAVNNHINGGIQLTGQALINADADQNGSITSSDVHYILNYILSGEWPSVSPVPPSGSVVFNNVSVGQNDLITIPVKIENGNNIRSTELIINYDASLIDYQTFASLMVASGNYVDAKELAPGKAKFTFVPSLSSSGNIQPGNLVLRFKEGIPSQGTEITTQFKLNDNEYTEGPKIVWGSVTGTGKEESVPSDFSLEQNYPNPFNPETRIRYNLPVNEFVTLKIYDILGNEVYTLVNEYKTAGRHETGFNASGLSSGIYIYKISAGKFTAAKKLLLLK